MNAMILLLKFEDNRMKITFFLHLSILLEHNICTNYICTKFYYVQFYAHAPKYLYTQINLSTISKIKTPQEMHVQHIMCICTLLSYRWTRYNGDMMGACEI